MQPRQHGRRRLLAAEDREGVDIGHSGQGEVERALAAAGAEVRIAAVAEQQRDHPFVPVSGRHHQRCRAVARAAIHVGTALEQDLRRGQLILVHGVQQERPIIHAGRPVGVGAASEQSGGPAGVTGTNGERELVDLGRVTAGQSEDHEREQAVT